MDTYQRLEDQVRELNEVVGAYEESHKSDTDNLNAIIDSLRAIISSRRGGSSVSVTSYQTGTIANMQAYQNLAESFQTSSTYVEKNMAQYEEAIQQYSTRMQEKQVAEEGRQNVALGFAKDGTTLAVNPIRDTFFTGNPELYYTVGNTSTLVSALAIPIGGTGTAALKAGTSPVRAMTVEGEKIFISEVAATKSSELIYEQTGSKIGAMAGGMFAGGFAYGGLTKLDSVANISGIHGKNVQVDNLKNHTEMKKGEGGKYSAFGEMSEADGIRYRDWNYEKIHEMSIHNPNSDSMTLGKYFDGTIESGSYVARAEATGDTYFSLGTQWDDISNAYELTDKDMFNIFNTRALDDAVAQGKTIRFSQNPLEWSGTALGDEWNYLQNNYRYTDLIEEGGYWYGIK